MKIKNIKKISILSIAFLPTSLFAALGDSYGFSTRGIGRAGAFVADVDDWSAPFFNLAGMTAPKTKTHYKVADQANELAKSTTSIVDGKEVVIPASLFSKMNTAYANTPLIESGFCYIYQISQTKITPNATNPTVQQNIGIGTSNMNYGMLQFGFSLDFRAVMKTPLNIPIRFGMVMALRDDGTLVSINDINPTNYNFFRLGKEPQTFTAILGISTQLWRDYISLGLGVGIGIGGKGSANISDISISLNNNQTLSHEIRVDVKPIIAPTAGLMFAIPLVVIDDFIRIGINYKRETLMNIDSLEIKAATNLLNLELPLVMALLDFYIPDIYNAGASYTTSNSSVILTTAFEAEYQRWSGFRVSSSKISYYNDKAIEIPKFNDIIVYKVAVEAKPVLIPFQFRVGYAHMPSFIPNQVGVTNYLDNTKNILSGGVTVFLHNNSIFKAKTKISLGVQYQMGQERRSDKDPSLASANLNPSYAYNANTTILSLDYGLMF